MTDPAWRLIRCPTCGAKRGEDCFSSNSRGDTCNMRAPHIKRKLATGWKPRYVQLPLEPTPAILKFLAGEPLILCASDEQNAREWYAKLLEIGGMK